MGACASSLEKAEKDVVETTQVDVNVTDQNPGKEPASPSSLSTSPVSPQFDPDNLEAWVYELHALPEEELRARLIHEGVKDVPEAADKGALVAMLRKQLDKPKRGATRLQNRISLPPAALSFRCLVASLSRCLADKDLASNRVRQ